MDINLLILLNQTTLVAKIVLGILIIMSVSSWAVIFQKWLSLRRAARRAAGGMEQFDRAPTLRDAVQLLGADPVSPLYGVANQGVTEFNRARGMGNSGEVVAENVRRALHQGVSIEMAKLSASLSFLATTANTAPFIGLFGTVWGIMHSFHSIGAMKSASLATVAPGISEALIATAVGLAVAVPATIGFNVFQNRLDRLEEQLINFAGMFLNRIQREINATRHVQRAE